MHRASAAARSAMKVVAAASVTVGGAVLGAVASRPGTAVAECHRGRPLGVGLALPLGLGLGLAAGCGRGAPTGFGGCLTAVLGFGRLAGAGLVGARAFAAAGLLAMGTGLGARLGGFSRGLGGGVLDEDVVVVVDEVVVVVEVVESKAEERAVGDSRGPWASRAGLDAGSCE